MNEEHLYQLIANEIRQKIIDGRYKPGDRLPSIRELTKQYHCTGGTVQHAYQELAQAGLVNGRAGQGTRVSSSINPTPTASQSPLRQVSLVHRAESFLLEALTAGYDLHEIQASVNIALDRWKTLETKAPISPARTLRFCGSHDMAVNWLAAHFDEIAAESRMEVSFSGSMSGLIALAEGQADLAGCHLWDVETGQYNDPYIQKLLTGRKTVITNLAFRRIGLMVAPGNPLEIKSLNDLTRSGIRFINRQVGSGTRVWLDAQLNQMEIPSTAVSGYTDEKSNHSDVARQIAEGAADVGLGLESAASAYRLDFIFMVREQYDLVSLADSSASPEIQLLFKWLQSGEPGQKMSELKGYDFSETGKQRFI